MTALERRLRDIRDKYDEGDLDYDEYLEETGNAWGEAIDRAYEEYVDQMLERRFREGES